MLGGLDDRRLTRGAWWFPLVVAFRASSVLAKSTIGLLPDPIPCNSPLAAQPPPMEPTQPGPPSFCRFSFSLILVFSLIFVL